MMIQYIKLHIDITANIDQISPYVNSECISYFDFGNTKIQGHYGHSCWWLPLGRIGLKIWNKNVAVPAEEILLEKIKAWDKLIDRAKYCRAYLPEIHMPLIVRHTGTYICGGTKRYDGINQFKEYPAFMMFNYDRPNKVSEDRLKTIKEAFIKDGIELHYDTFRREQLGIHRDHVVVLDLHDTKGEVYL